MFCKQEKKAFTDFWSDLEFCGEYNLLIVMRMNPKAKRPMARGGILWGAAQVA